MDEDDLASAVGRSETVRVQGSGFRVQGSGFRVQGLGFRGKTALRTNPQTLARRLFPCLLHGG